MSNVEDRLSELETSAELDRRYRAARAEIERKERLRQGEAGALVFAALAYGEEEARGAGLARAAHISKLICIAAVFVIPNLLFIRVVL